MYAKGLHVVSNGGDAVRCRSCEEVRLKQAEVASLQRAVKEAWLVGCKINKQSLITSIHLFIFTRTLFTHEISILGKSIQLGCT